LDRFFQESLDHFLSIMHQTGTIVTGSCALKMLLGLLHDSSSSDLNLVVPHNKFFAMDVFLRNVAGYGAVEGQMEPHSSVAPSVARFVRYQKSHLSVSLAQAGVIGPMRVIACSDATADMTFMTAGGVATWYPEFTLCGINMRSEKKKVGREGEGRIGSAKSDVLDLKTDTSFLRGPCGRSCPSLWRSMADYGPYGVFSWDARYDVKRVFGKCDVEFRVSERCVNDDCERDKEKKRWLCGPPGSMVPADEIDIEMQERNITSRHPVGAPSWQHVELCVDRAIHSPTKPGMWAYYMRLALDSQYWFTFH
jgi:hypothetical protein